MLLDLASGLHDLVLLDTGAKSRTKLGPMKALIRVECDWCRVDPPYSFFVISCPLLISFVLLFHTLHILYMTLSFFPSTKYRATS